MEKHTLVFFRLARGEPEGFAQFVIREQRVLVIENGEVESEHPTLRRADRKGHRVEPIVATPLRRVDRNLGLVPGSLAAGACVAPLGVQERACLGRQHVVAYVMRVFDRSQPRQRAVSLMGTYEPV